MKSGSKRLYIVGSTILIACCMIMIIILFSIYQKPLNVKADDEKCTVSVTKVSTVSIYVTGSGVKLISDDVSKSIYEVEKNTQVILTAVNESRLFKNWIIKDENNSSTTGDGDENKRITFNCTENINVNLKRTDPTINDLGKYIDNSFSLSSEAHLLYLDTIFKAKINSTSITNQELFNAYAYFFNSDPTFKETFIDSDTSETPLTIEQKITQINNGNYFERIQNGYYKVEESFTVLQDSFLGIGSKTIPFKGVLCGLNDSNSSNAQIFLSINATETNEDQYLGLFKYLDQNAVIRNLIVKNSIGVSENTTTNQNNVYVGGVAGEINNTLLINLSVSSALNIETLNQNIYAGGLAGVMRGGIDDISNISLNFTNNTWVLTSGINDNIFGGLVAGFAENLYLKKIDINVTQYAINAKIITENTSSYTNTTNIHLGNLFGYYKNTIKTKLENINIYGTESEYIHANIAYGNNYVGGLIGYIETTDDLVLGKTTFSINSSEQTKIIAESFNEDSQANIYAGGLVAYVNGTTFMANDDFKNGIIKTIVDSKEVENYHYLFDLPLEIIAKQQGMQANSTSYGSAIAAGLVAYGYFNINGTTDNRSNILLSEGKYKFSVNAIQSSMSNHILTTSSNYVGAGNLTNNPHHCLASLVFGYLEAGSDTNNYTYQNINIYGNNIKVEAIREIGSRSLGDVNAAGFLCYAKGRNFQNIGIYLGENTYINANSLSYEVGYQGSSNVNQSNNNNFVSSFISHLIGNLSTIKNIKISGYDFNNQKEIGSSVQIEGIQNSKAINGTTTCRDYTNENYVGGVIGCTRGTLTIDEINFEGNEINKPQIVMQGHRDPNSAFVGGIIGFSKLIMDNLATQAPQTIKNTKINNVQIYGSATIDNNAKYNNPDIYTGGIVGACYSGGQGAKLTIDNAKVINTQIDGIGNERIEVYTGGILGTLTWSGSVEINDAYVYKSKITSAVDASTVINFNRGCAHAGGIIGSYTSSYLTVTNSSLIESVVTSNCSNNIINTTTNNTNTKSIAAAVYASSNNTNLSTVKNFYTNATIDATDNTTTKTYVKEYIYGNVGTLNNSYYVKNINDFTDNKGNQLDLEEKEFTTINETKKVSDLFGFITNHASSNSVKLFIKPSAQSDKDNLEINWTSGGTTELEITALKENITTEIEIWVNIKENGTNSSPNDFTTENQLIENGWFKLGTSFILCGNNSGNITFSDDSFSQSYIDNNNEYFFTNIVNGKYQFVTHVEPIKYLYDIGYIKKDQTTLQYEINSQQVSFDCYPTDIYLKSVIPTLKIKFQVKNTTPTTNIIPPIHYLSWFINSTTGIKEVTLDENPLSGYGSYQYTYQVIEYDKTNHYYLINYELQFTPNKEFTDDIVLYAAFYTGGTSTNSEKTFSNKCLQFNIYANKYEIIGGTLASYTPPMNENIENLGQSNDKPYYFQSNTSYKIIPLLRRKNESETIINSELYIQDVIYSLNNTIAGTIRSNGELTTSSEEDSTKTYEVELTLKADTTKKVKIYFVIVTKYNVSYTAEGATISGLPFATDASSYNLQIDILAHCGGTPDSFIIDINNQKYNLLEKTTQGELKYQWIYNEEGTKLTNFDNTSSYYTLKIPNYLNNTENDQIINGNIKINISFPVNFTIEFHLQTDTFNPEFGKTNSTIKSFKVKSGTTFKDTFTTDVKKELDDWTKAANDASFGYLFTGFFLIDDSTSITSYGKSFDEILNQESTIKINTSYVFYARWSFLIELVEAPGTHIVTSFNQDFLYEVNKDEYNGLLNKNVTIPINNNRGYVFTIVKDDNFIGEADVDAYIITGTKQDQIITEITIEKYHENMYLYYISPESIKGYLVISTKISNSQVIVGENTASVSKDILPEDGIYTYKYVVNHKKGETYIYNGENGKNNLAINRNLIIEFFQDNYDYTNNLTTTIPRILPKGTTIEVYYNKYINSNSLSDQTILGTYTVNEENITKVKLNQFKNFNGNDNAFEELTFGQLLSNYNSLSEVYYFVIIPPNGYNHNTYDEDSGLMGEYVNYHLYVGYVDESDQYITGIRSNNNFTNIPIEDVLYEKLESESSCQQTKYTVIPSRTTNLIKKDNTNTSYHFIDDDEFIVFDVNVIDGGLATNNRVKFFASVENKETIIKSNKIDGGIEKLVLNLGYNKGTIRVSGSTNDVDYDDIQIIEVSNELSTDYTIDFDVTKNYKYFKIEKLSDLELRLSKIGLKIIRSPKLYELEFSETDFEHIYLPNYSVRNINLPIKNGFTWTVSDNPAVKIENNVLVITKQATTQKVTLKGRYEQIDKVSVRNFEITIPATTTSDIINKMILPSESTSSIILPNATDLVWTIDSGDATITNNILTLTGHTQEITLTASYGTTSKQFKIKMEENLSVYTLRENIIGDVRHDGKRFILAVQIKNSENQIVEDTKNITLLINGNEYYPLINGENLNVLYFDLSSILDLIGGDSFDIKINGIDSSYSISAVQLLECSLNVKPAMGEIRASYSF